MSAQGPRVRNPTGREGGGASSAGRAVSLDRAPDADTPLGQESHAPSGLRRTGEGQLRPLQVEASAYVPGRDGGSEAIIGI